MNRDQPPRRIDAPEPCFIQTRFVSGGPLVGARIWRRFGTLCAEINGFPSSVMQVWTQGERCDEQTYLTLMANPPDNPYVALPKARADLKEAMDEQQELDWLHTRPIR